MEPNAEPSGGQRDLGWPGSTIHRLAAISNSLRLYGLLLSMGTLFNILAPVAVVVFFALQQGQIVGTALIVAGLTAINIMVAVMFDMLRKRGEVIFEEVSDEFQWYVGRTESSTMERPGPRPDFAVRLVLRDFARAGDLPLARGRNGPATYVVVNIFVLFLLAYEILSLRH